MCDCLNLSDNSKTSNSQELHKYARPTKSPPQCSPRGGRLRQMHKRTFSENSGWPCFLARDTYFYLEHFIFLHMYVKLSISCPSKTQAGRFKVWPHSKALSQQQSKTDPKWSVCVGTIEVHSRHCFCRHYWAFCLFPFIPDLPFREFPTTDCCGELQFGRSTSSYANIAGGGTTSCAQQSNCPGSKDSRWPGPGIHSAHTAVWRPCSPCSMAPAAQLWPVLASLSTASLSIPWPLCNSKCV